MNKEELQNYLGSLFPKKSLCLTCYKNPNRENPMPTGCSYLFWTYEGIDANYEKKIIRYCKEYERVSGSERDK